MASKHIPQKVLGQQLAEMIKGRRVRTAVFISPGRKSAPHPNGRRYPIIGRYSRLL
jgi:hypothetical protein